MLPQNLKSLGSAMNHCPATFQERARLASQTALLKEYWGNRSHLRRQHTTRTLPANFSTKRGRRQHKQDPRRARASRKMGWAEISRPAQSESVVQPSSAFFFAPPTAPTIPRTATRNVLIHVRRYGTVHVKLSTGIDPSPASSSATLLPSPSSSTTGQQQHHHHQTHHQPGT